MYAYNEMLDWEDWLRFCEGVPLRSPVRGNDVCVDDICGCSGAEDGKDIRSLDSEDDLFSKGDETGQNIRYDVRGKIDQ